VKEMKTHTGGGEETETHTSEREIYKKQRSTQDRETVRQRYIQEIETLTGDRDTYKRYRHALEIETHLRDRDTHNRQRHI